MSGFVRLTGMSYSLLSNLLAADMHRNIAQCGQLGLGAHLLFPFAVQNLLHERVRCAFRPNGINIIWISGNIAQRIDD